MSTIARNGLTLTELEQIEESAHRSKTREAETVLRLSAALREALQEKLNALAVIVELKRAEQPTSISDSETQSRNVLRLPERLKKARRAQEDDARPTKYRRHD